MSTDFDPYYKWLGIAPEEQPPNHYRLLGIRPFEEDPDVIENAADQKVIHLRTFQLSKQRDLAETLLNEIAATKICLLSAEKKAVYDTKLRELLVSKASRAASQARRQSSNMPLLLIGGVVAVLALAIAAWSLLGRGSGKAATGSGHLAKVESERPEAADTGQPRTVGPQPLVPNPPSPIPGPQSLIPASSSPPTPAESRSPKVGEKPTVPALPQPALREKKVARRPGDGVTPPGLGEKTQPQAMAKSDVTNLKTETKLPASDPQSPIPNPAPSRRPIPTESAQDEARRQAQALYRDDYPKAKKPAERAELCRKILKQAQESAAAPADRYVLLCLAREVALSADDGQLAFAAIDELAKSFEVDGLSLKAEALTALVKSAHGVTLHKGLCERALSLGREALDQDHIELADRLAKLAYTEAGKVRDKGLVQRSRALAKEGHDAARAFAAMQEACQTLKEHPDDPAANLAVGQYLCFTKGDWSKGLLHLSKSDDSGLKSLADDEGKNSPPPWEPAPGVAPPNPPPAPAALRLADGWWEAGQAAAGKPRDRILLHAGYWYNQSFVSDTAPLVATKINNRLEQIEKIRRQSPAPPLAIAPFDARQAREHQHRWAEYLGLPVVMTNSIGMKFVLIPPGEYEMGSTDAQTARAFEYGKREKESDWQWYSTLVSSERPIHRVRISRGLYLGIFETTQAEYLAVTGIAPSHFRAGGVGEQEVAGVDTRRRPVEMVSWEDAVGFCRKLSDLPQERVTRREYRLPTEAEWEYCGRAGTTTDWSFGDNPADLGRYAWFSGNSGQMTHPVGLKKPNAWGFYDIYGNVGEWCADWFAKNYYQSSPLLDPLGPPVGPGRVQRGGAWIHYGSNTRQAFRKSGGPQIRLKAVGFRVVLIP